MIEQLVSFTKEYPIILAPFLGVIPALIWLFFWLKEDTHPEPPRMITLAFLGGMLSVLLVLPLQKFTYPYISQYQALSFAIWAGLEEIFKFVVVYYVVLRTRVADEPVDDMIYLIVSALGFVALENTLFLIDPIHTGDLTGIILTGNMRFIGASLLHTISSATIGICMGLSFYKDEKKKLLYLLSGISMAIVLHTTFNLFIISGTEGNIFFVFGAVWVGIIALLLLFEKVKHISPNNN